MRQHREEFILAPIRIPESILCPLPLGDVAHGANAVERHPLGVPNGRMPYFRPDNRTVLTYETFLDLIKRNLTGHELTVQVDIQRTIFGVSHVVDAALKELVLVVSQSTA